jgi:Esterase PHB depolymerase
MRMVILAFGRSGCRTLCAALLTISMVVGADAAEPREESGFGSNPGNLRMFSYVPASLLPGAALIVVLHGCKQRAVTFARDAGWLALASRSRVALLLPEQKGLPSFLHDVFLFPWVVVALWEPRRAAAFSAGGSARRACRSRQPAIGAALPLRGALSASRSARGAADGRHSHEVLVHIENSHPSPSRRLSDSRVRRIVPGPILGECKASVRSPSCSACSAT